MENPNCSTGDNKPLPSQHTPPLERTLDRCNHTPPLNCWTSLWSSPEHPHARCKYHCENGCLLHVHVLSEHIRPTCPEQTRTCLWRAFGTSEPCRYVTGGWGQYNKLVMINIGEHVADHIWERYERCQEGRDGLDDLFDPLIGWKGL